jgi:hypothetical protein
LVMLDYNIGLNDMKSVLLTKKRALAYLRWMGAHQPCLLRKAG